MKKLKAFKFLPADALYDVMDSPVGELTIIATPAALHAILWEAERNDLRYKKIISDFNRSPNEEIIMGVKKQLAEYFQGKRRKFHIPLAINGTPFQTAVWQQLLAIPYSTTISYAEQAERVGNKNKARAVGMANGLNPISIIIPCHRVVGSNGKLVGFGGGIENKAYLLNLEQAHRPRLR
jgi:methylated-DNA-[protein]-cysteine S-methyltransferase